MGNCKYYEICGLTDDADPQNRLCILHSLNAEKDGEAFEEALNAHRKKSGDNFAHIFFPKPMDFSGATFTEQANFNGTTFSKATKFMEARFNSGADFNGALFNDEVDFFTTTFISRIKFNGTTFSRAYFNGTIFPLETDFSRAVFNEEVDFSLTRFDGWANFRAATFNKGAIFRGARFNQKTRSDKLTVDADFSQVVFNEEADFSATRFVGRTKFNGAAFSKVNFNGVWFAEEPDFFQAVFNKQALFALTKFAEGANFNGVTFHEEAFFSRAAFIKTTSFAGVTFAGRADFTKATFTDGVNINGATFNEQTFFSQATFIKKTFFAGVTFSKRADFHRATFHEEAFFSRAAFSDGADFSAAMFQSEIDFSETKFEGISNFSFCSFLSRAAFKPRQEGNGTLPIFSEAYIDFRQVVFSSLAAITFLIADLRKCCFQDTDVRKIQFVGVIWPKHRGRHIVYDEIASDNRDPNYPRDRIERLYRELKQNYEDRKDYQRAGDFHYGEKEMQRRNPKNPLGDRFILTLYWLLSGYGERYLRPLIWASILFIMGTCGYILFGLSPKEGGPILTWQSPLDWLKAAHYSFRVISFLKPDDLVPIRYAKLVSTVQSILGPIFIGFFGLALRQRLKR